MFRTSTTMTVKYFTTEQYFDPECVGNNLIIKITHAMSWCMWSNLPGSLSKFLHGEERGYEATWTQCCNGTMQIWGQGIFQIPNLVQLENSCPFCYVPCFLVGWGFHLLSPSRFVLYSHYLAHEQCEVHCSQTVRVREYDVWQVEVCGQYLQCEANYG